MSKRTTKNRLYSLLSVIAFLGYLGYQYMLDPVALEGDEHVELVACVDGDTAKFKAGEETNSYRFLAIDTPETIHPTKEVEYMGPEASTATCSALSDASNIRLEYETGETSDKYGRKLAWVFVDGELLQTKLVKQGYAKVAYEKNSYKYVEELRKAQTQAQQDRVGIWGQ